MPLTDVIPSQRQAGMLILAFAAGVAVGANWPAIRQALGPLLAAAGTKVDDLYAAVAQAIGEQKEAVQDARAERQHRARRQARRAERRERVADRPGFSPQGSRAARRQAGAQAAGSPRQAEGPGRARRRQLR